MIGQTDGAQINEHGDLIPTRTAVKTERRFALVVTSHRGDLYLPETLEIARQMLPWDRFTKRIAHLDGGGKVPSPLGKPESDVGIVVSPWKRGLAQAVSAVWRTAADVDFVFHLEEDFHLLEPVDLDGMADVIERDNLAQMCLYRQPWTPQEAAAGGYMRLHAGYEQRAEYVFNRRCFSLNPCLIPAHVIREGWPHGNEAEQTARWEDAGFGVWGQLDDPPRCLHVGAEGGMGSPGWTP